MYKYNKESFKRFFFYGDENPEGALEGIIYFSYQNDFFGKWIKRKEQMTEEQIIDELVQSVKPLYKQYYRFIELNNRCKIYNMYQQTDEKELEERIRSKIEKLRTTDEIITEEEIQGKIWEIRQRRNAIYEACEKTGKWSNWDRENWRRQTEEIIKRTREELEGRRTKQLTIADHYISYSVVQRIKYAHLPEGTTNNMYPAYVPYNKQEECIPYVLRHWTEELYDLLKFLNGVEKKDSKVYTAMWLRTRLKRAKNGTIEGIDETEIQRLEHNCNNMMKELKSEEKGQEKEKI